MVVMMTVMKRMRMKGEKSLLTFYLRKVALERMNPVSQALGPFLCQVRESWWDQGWLFVPPVLAQPTSMFATGLGWRPTPVRGCVWRCAAVGYTWMCPRGGGGGGLGWALRRAGLSEEFKMDTVLGAGFCGEISADVILEKGDWVRCGDRPGG